MSADKPNKSNRRENDRPFKTYNLELPTTFQFSGARQYPQSMMLPTVPFAAHQPQQNRHLQQQEQQQPQQSRILLQAEQQPQQSRILLQVEQQQQQPQQSRILLQAEQPQQSRILLQAEQPQQSRILLQQGQQQQQEQQQSRVLVQTEQQQQQQQQQLQQSHLLQQGQHQPPQHNRILLQAEQQQQQPQQSHLLQQGQQQQQRRQQSRHLPQHEQQQQQNQQLASGQLNESSLHLFGGHVNFRQNAPQRQPSVQNITVDLDSANFVYDQLSLDDSGSALLRPDLMTSNPSLIQQSEQDLNIFSASCSASSSQIQNVFPTNVSATKSPFDALMSGQESQTLYDNVLAAPSSSLPRSSVPPFVMSTMGNANFFHNPTASRRNVTATSPFSFMPVSSSGMSLPATTMSSVTQTAQFPVKLEAENETVLAMGNLNTPAASFSQNEPNQNFFLDKFRNIATNAFPQTSSSTSFPLVNSTMGSIATNAFPQTSSSTTSFPLVNSAMGNTHGISPALTSPVRVFQGSFMSSNRSPSECSTSSANLSLDDSTFTSPNSPSRSDGDSRKTVGAKDGSYMEKRRKNNESAKRSRDARRSKEGKIVFEVITLQQENLRLRTEIQLLENENVVLRIRVNGYVPKGNIGNFDFTSAGQFLPTTQDLG